MKSADPQHEITRSPRATRDCRRTIVRRWSIVRCVAVRGLWRLCLTDVTPRTPAHLSAWIARPCRSVRAAVPPRTPQTAWKVWAESGTRRVWCATRAGASSTRPSRACLWSCRASPTARRVPKRAAQAPALPLQEHPCIPPLRRHRSRRPGRLPRRPTSTARWARSLSLRQRSQRRMQRQHPPPSRAARLLRLLQTQRALRATWLLGLAPSVLPRRPNQSPSQRSLHPLLELELRQLRPQRRLQSRLFGLRRSRRRCLRHQRAAQARLLLPQLWPSQHPSSAEARRAVAAQRRCTRPKR